MLSIHCYNSKMVDRDKEWEFHLRSLSSTSRDSNYATDPASDPSLLNSVDSSCALNMLSDFMHFAEFGIYLFM